MQHHDKVQYCHESKLCSNLSDTIWNYYERIYILQYEDDMINYFHNNLKSILLMHNTQCVTKHINTIFSKKPFKWDKPHKYGITLMEYVLNRRLFDLASILMHYGADPHIYANHNFPSPISIILCSYIHENYDRLDAYGIVFDKIDRIINNKYVRKNKHAVKSTIKRIWEDDKYMYLLEKILKGLPPLDIANIFLWDSIDIELLNFNNLANLCNKMLINGCDLNYCEGITYDGDMVKKLTLMYLFESYLNYRDYREEIFKIIKLLLGSYDFILEGEIYFNDGFELIRNRQNVIEYFIDSIGHNLPPPIGKPITTQDYYPIIPLFSEYLKKRRINKRIIKKLIKKLPLPIAEEIECEIVAVREYRDYPDLLGSIKAAVQFHRRAERERIAEQRT